MENALLRERINDNRRRSRKTRHAGSRGPKLPDRGHAGRGTGNAREKPPDPPAATVANGATANGSVPPEGGGTLAERIRALQYHASRARQQAADLISLGGFGADSLTPAPCPFVNRGL